MKKIFTLMLAFACALFVGVSCTNEGTDDGGTTTPPTTEPTYDVVLTVGELAEPFAANGGTATLSVTLSKDVIGANVVAETSATWLEVSVTENNEVALTAQAFTAVAAPRTAEVTVSYVNESNENLAAPVTATVSQVSPEAKFTVEWSNQTQVGATATVTAVEPDICFGAFTFGESALMQGAGGGVGPLNADEATMMSPVDYATSQLELFAAPMGYGGLGIAFAQMADPNMGGTALLYPHMTGNVMNCSLYGWRGAEKKMYLAVVGLNWGLNMDTYEDTTTQKGLVHVFEVENLPQPAVSIAKESVTASYAEDCVIIDCNVENPTWDGVLTAESDSEWLDAAASSAGKLHLYCKENAYAKSRNAEVTVTYTYKCMITQYGETMEMPITTTATVKVEQKANPNVTPVTFTITVKETHFNKIVVDVVPSDANAYYVLGTESKSNVNNYAQWYSNAWDAVCEYALGGTPLQGTQTNYEFSIDTRYASDETDWTYYVYAFQTNAECTVVAGEPTYVETPITNDAPSVACPEGFTEGSSGEFVLDVYGNGGDYNVKLEVVNAPADGYALKLYDSSTWKRVDETTVQTTTLNHASTVFGNEQKVSIENGYLKFTVNNFPADWDKSFDPYAEFTLHLTDAENTQSYKNYTVRVRLHPAE